MLFSDALRVVHIFQLGFVETTTDLNSKIHVAMSLHQMKCLKNDNILTKRWFQSMIFTSFFDKNGKSVQLTSSSGKAKVGKIMRKIF